MRRNLKKRSKTILLCFLSLMIVLPTSVLANLSVPLNDQVDGIVLSQDNELAEETTINNPEANSVVDEKMDAVEEDQTDEQPSGEETSPPEAPLDDMLPPDAIDQQSPVNHQVNPPGTENKDVEIETVSKNENQTNDLQREKNNDIAPLKRGESMYRPFFNMLAALDGLTTRNLDFVTKEQLVEKFVGKDIEVSNVTFNGVNRSAGTFSGGADIIGFDEGIILSNGNIDDVIGPNDNDGVGTNNGIGGDEDLKQLIPGFELYDATTLEFDFIPNHDTLSFRYVFSSEEYNEYVGQGYNDVFGFFVNGVNVALVPGTDIPVSINNINLHNHSQYFINNEVEDIFDPAGLLNTQMDGLTIVMTATTTVNIGEVNHIKLAIADGGDSTVDSNVFIEAGSFSSIDTVAPENPTVVDVSDHDEVVTGSTEPGATIIVKVGEKEIGTTQADDTGKFSLTVPKQTAGTVLSVFARDEAGNISEPTMLTVLDKTPPVKPTVHKVTDQDTSVSGQTEAKAKIEVKVNGQLIASSTADEVGKFAVLIPKQASGTTLVVTATDSAGNTSEPVSIVVTKQPLPRDNVLPNTATNHYNLLFAGLAMVVIGGSRLVFRRKINQ